MINKWFNRFYSHKLGRKLVAIISLAMLITPTIGIFPSATHGQQEDPDNDKVPATGSGNADNKKVVDRPTFSCNADGEAPKTLVTTPDGEILTFINWQSNAFGDNFTPERRCQIVTQRLQTYSSSGKLETLIASRMNGVPVICVGQNNRCDSSLPDNGLVITVRPRVDPMRTLQQIADFRNGSGGELTETGSGLRSLNMHCYLTQKKPANYAQCVRTQNTSRSTIGRSIENNGSTRRNNVPKPSGSRRF